MAYKVVFGLVLSSWIYLSLASDFYSTPHILLNGTEDIIEANDNYTIFCQGNKPLEWTTPSVNVKTSETFSTIFTTVEETPSSSNFQYGLRLYITNISYPFVGFYNCHFKNAQDISEKNDENDRIYLFVDDKNHLAAFGDDTRTILNVYVVQHHTAIIPCRPTSPKVHVQLSLVDDFSEEIDQTFDEKIGFSFLFSDPSQCGIYMCLFSRDNETFDLLVNLELGDPYTSYIPAPSVTDEKKGHTNVGDKISLKCNLQFTNADVIFSWTTPSGVFNPSRMNKTDIEKGSLLTISDSTLEDSGVYTCHVRDHQKHHVSRNISIRVYDKEEHNITMREPTDTYYVEAKAGQASVTWSVEVWGHPEPLFYWLNNKNDKIVEEKGKKYEVFRSKSNKPLNQEVITLKIKNIDLINDFGYYTLVGENHFNKKELEFFLNITDKPTVTLRTNPTYHLVGLPGKVECLAAAHPAPVFEWQYKECLRSECQFNLIPSEVTQTEGLTVSSQIIINTTEIGVVKCTATNSVGSESDQMDYIVTDTEGGFSIGGFDDTVLIDDKNETATYAIGEKIYVSCSASFYNYSQPEWFFNGSAVVENDRLKLFYGQTEFSNNVTLEIENINYEDSGLYSCKVLSNKTENIFKNMSFLVSDPVRAEIIESNMDGEIVEDFPKSVIFQCMVKGIPKPKIFWYKNNVDFNPTGPRIRFEYDNQILIFNETKATDQGTYKCSAIYRDSLDFREVKLKFRNAPGVMQDWLIYIIAFLVIALLILMIYLFIRLRNERKLKREMQLLGLANFEKGAVENINPELGIDDQAELLPYDRKWEFPIEQLKLGKQLGSGAFGVVLKGEAKHIVDEEPITTVAVKMVKKNADNTYIKALASELKIMVHLGKHLNVVNLLGACTKNVAKRELLVIVEYCRFGNIQNFLLRHREHYINQIDSHTGKVNYLIGQEELMDRTYSVSSNRSNTQSPLLKYAALVFSDTSDNPILPPPNAMGDYRGNPNTGATDITTITQGDETVILSNNSVQPEWRSNYKGDYKGNVNPISTKDLIAWSFQIARGMEYLASRKVLHGDLAARNVLLSDNNIVKICDFGLAKSMYKNDNYKKRENCPLPVKWMAIESIRDRVFSTQSDVWSFGIVLWEIFSLGRTPYPGMEADERLYHKLVDGYRLESPEYSPKEIYQIMTECWSVKPTTRPSFTKLTEKIGTLLEDTLRKHYIDLNDPYLAMNTKMLEEKNDYLAMLSPPTFEEILSPHYVNDMVGQTEPSSEEGYMSMKPNAIFSPRLTNDQVFDFATTNRKKLSGEYGNGHELLPMLHVKSESEPGTPVTPGNAVSNPSYHLPPKINIVESNVDTNNGIVKSADNYVNMPQNKNLLKDSKLILNIDNKNSETPPPYVNQSTNEWESIQV